MKPRRYRVDPAARAALETVAVADWTNMVLSNHVPELERILTDVGLRDLVDRVFTSARTGYEKPHRQAFEVPLREAGEHLFVDGGDLVRQWLDHRNMNGKDRIE